MGEADASFKQPLGSRPHFLESGVDFPDARVGIDGGNSAIQPAILALAIAAHIAAWACIDAIAAIVAQAGGLKLNAEQPEQGFQMIHAQVVAFVAAFVPTVITALVLLFADAVAHVGPFADAFTQVRPFAVIPADIRPFASVAAFNALAGVAAIIAFAFGIAQFGAGPDVAVAAIGAAFAHVRSFVFTAQVFAFAAAQIGSFAAREFEAFIARV